MNLFKNTKNHQNINDGNKNNKYEAILGFIFFLIIFILVIPYILIKNKHYTLLEVYMPNVDLIANLLSWHQGVIPMWRHLYKSAPTNNIEFLTQTFINYIALLGLTYIVIRESTGKGQQLSSGWSIAFVMLIMTYLLPSKIINHIMQKTHNLLIQLISTNNNSRNTYSFTHKIIHILTWVVGFILTIGIIWLESRVINHFQTPLFNLSKKIISLPKMI